MFSNWVNAIVATALISAFPNFLLLLIPNTWLKASSKLESINIMNVFLSFAAGGLLGDVFLHTLPHLLAEHDENNTADQHSNAEKHDDEHFQAFIVGTCVLIGFFTFFVLDRLAGITLGIENSNEVETVHAHPILSANSTVKKRKQKASQDYSITLGSAKSHQSMKPSIFSRISSSGYLNLFADSMHNFTDGLALGASFANASSAGNFQLGIAKAISVFCHEIPHEIGDYAILIDSGMRYECCNST